MAVAVRRQMQTRTKAVASATGIVLLVLAALLVTSASSFAHDNPIAASFVHDQNGQCLGVQGNQTNNGAAISQWPCIGQQNQQFEIIHVGGYHQLRFKHSNRCLQATGNGLSVEQWDCNSSNARQLWSGTMRHNDVTPHQNIHFQGRCLDNQGSFTQGTLIVLSPCSGGNSQRWRTHENFASIATFTYSLRELAQTQFLGRQEVFYRWNASSAIDIHRSELWFAIQDHRPLSCSKSLTYYRQPPGTSQKETEYFYSPPWYSGHGWQTSRYWHEDLAGDVYNKSPIAVSDHGIGNMSWSQCQDRSRLGATAGLIFEFHQNGLITWTVRSH